MWEYVQPQTSDELYHYGVKGMRWGVRRASKKLSKATDEKKKAKAVASLEKHREKGTAEIKKLDSSTSKLQAKREKQRQTTDVKAAEYEKRAADAMVRSQTPIMLRSRREKFRNEANKWYVRADSLRAESERTQALINKNESLKKMFQQEIDKIDQALVEKGKRRLNAK